MIHFVKKQSPETFTSNKQHANGTFFGSSTVLMVKLSWLIKAVAPNITNFTSVKTAHCILLTARTSLKSNSGQIFLRENTVPFHSVENRKSF